MDYEKKYNEMVRRAKELYESGNALTRQQMEIVCPELTESEDERIRKFLLRLAERCNENSIDFMGDIKKKNVIAYLEKQKAKEQLDRMAPIYNNKESFESALEKAWKYYNESSSRTVDSFDDDYIECVFSKGFREGFLYKEKQKEQKPVEPSDEELQRHQDELYDFKVFAAKQAKEHHISFVHDFEWNNFCAELLSYFNEKQKPAEWSEEDDALLKEIVSFFKDGTVKLQHDLDLYAGFLQNKFKSLCPQPKQEWSEEDEMRLNHLIKFVEKYGLQFYASTDKVIDWLKSLRNGIFQNGNTHWKPSEEQMEALMLAIEGKCPLPTSYMSRRLEDLYEGLVNTYNIECKLK